MTAHSTLSGAELHDPKGVYPTVATLANQNEALRYEDASGYGVINANLVDDEVMIGDSNRPLVLKIYDADIGATVKIAPVVKPKGFDASPSSGTCQGLYQFAGNLNDSSGNGRTLTAAGTGVHQFTSCWGKSGVILDGARWFTGGATGFTSTAEITIEALVRLSWKGAYGAIVSLQDSTASAPASRSQYSLLAGYTVTPFNSLYYFHQTSAPGTIAWTPAALVPGELCALTLTRDSAGTGLSLYLNGALVDSTTVATAPGGTAPNTLFVGGAAWSGGNYEWEGELYSIAIHTGIEMGAAEVLTRHEVALGRGLQ